MDKDIFRFIGNTGLRKSEFSAMRWEHISADMKYVHITGKGRKNRVVPLNSTVCEILLRYERLSNDYVQFCRRYYGKEGISWLCRRTVKLVGIPRFGAHAL